MRQVSQGLQATALLISVLGFSVLANSQGREKSPSSVEYATSLTIQSVSRTVKTGSPVWVDLTEKNNSDQTLPFGRAKPSTMDQGGQIYQVDILDEQGVRPTETTFYRRKLGHLTPEERAQLELPMGGGIIFFVKPGDSITDRIDVGRLYDLNNPGKYTILVKFPVRSNQLPVQSNTITITVTR